MVWTRNYFAGQSQYMSRYNSYGKVIPDFDSGDPMKTLLFLFCGYLFPIWVIFIPNISIHHAFFTRHKMVFVSEKHNFYVKHYRKTFSFSNIFLKFFHDGGRYHIETSTLICSVNQWTGFYMITVCVMIELNSFCFHRRRVQDDYLN